MSKRKLNNKTLDAIGRHLIENGSPRSNDVESIISNPRLYSMVKARIAADAHTPVYVIHKNRAILTFARQYSVAVVGAAMVLIAIIIGAASLLRPENPQLASEKIQVPEVVPDVARPIVTPFKPVVSKLSAGRASDHEAPAEKIVARSSIRRTDRKPPPPPGRETQDEFYPVSAVYDADETGGRIVRVDVPK